MVKRIAVVLAALTAACTLIASCGEDESLLTAQPANTGADAAAEVTESENANMSALAAFSSKTVGGEEITGSIFSENKITMVNIWATWCPPCVGEMPELAIVANQLPEGAGLISVCIDAGDSQDSLDLAKQILSDAGCDFPAIIPDDVINSELLESVAAIPTTFFIDSSGNPVGEPKVGSDDSLAYLSLIESALKSVS